MSYNPSAPGIDNGNLFGLPNTLDEATIAIIPVPQEITVSYQGGCAHGPQQVLEASRQLDLYDFDNPTGWQRGIHLLKPSDAIVELNKELRPKAVEIIAELEQGRQPLKGCLPLVNNGCKEIHDIVYNQANELLLKEKLVGVLGGDHSSPLGLLKALANHHESFGILQIDAHADLRTAYEGFTHSHASIMYNALKIPSIEKLVPVSVRDICQEEMDFIDANTDHIIPFFDHDLQKAKFKGQHWPTIAQNIINQLPQKVYISLDVDGLDPKLCPNTGTPVPGGLDYYEAIEIIRQVVASGRQVIGFDLCEVGDNRWDGNVGARLLYKLCMLSLSHH